jgi:predicted nucleic acid-binding protein
MSLAYVDSSFLVAWFAPWTPQGPAVVAHMEHRPVDFFWNPVLRAELRHSLRRLQLPEHERKLAWQAYRATEKWRVRLVPHPFSFERMVDRTDELSSETAQAVGAGTWDLFHIACAEAVGADIFLTCDEAQSEAAKKAGLRSVYLRA